MQNDQRPAEWLRRDPLEKDKKNKQIKDARKFLGKINRTGNGKHSKQQKKK